MISSINSGMSVIQQSQQSVNKAASTLASAEVANGPTPEQPQATSLHEPLVDLVQAETYSRAGTKVIETSNEMLGSLLDIKV
ncbi:hypothetical protein [Ferrimonas aestuarii]|uniref:Flagellar basal body rod FlgEFG protein C-terminal n=1 Tax=Ferrimonas aestuarii TaxID=2569539 RepID=A0A4U1BRP5_9GAMM|nr:hypothetical protein [Ferrimonas aestuarii]TKB58283.1 hypothetical protein FCL42_00550 [Ferrimonas aestuarii]